METDVYPVGGHYRLRVGPGGEVLGSRAFLRTCMPLRHGLPRCRKKQQNLRCTHGLDDAPTEIHAFASRYFPLPLMVITVENRAIWGVTDGAIQYLEQVEEDGTDAAEVS